MDEKQEETAFADEDTLGDILQNKPNDNKFAMLSFRNYFNNKNFVIGFPVTVFIVSLIFVFVLISSVESSTFESEFQCVCICFEIE